MVNLKYGNELSIMFEYSHAAILIDIPSRGEQRVPTVVSKYPGYHGMNRGPVAERCEERAVFGLPMPAMSPWSQ